MHLYAHHSLAAPLVQSLVARRFESPVTNPAGALDAPTATLRAGKNPDRALEDTRLLTVDDAELVDGHVTDLGRHLRAGDLLVLNDAATLPASLSGTAKAKPVEVRLAAAAEGEVADVPAKFWVVLFGAGSWRDDTDARPAPPRLRPGDVILFDRGLSAMVTHVSPVSPRLVRVKFDRQGDALTEALYEEGAAVQYRHLDAPLPLAAVQTPFAVHPWAVEMPSTGRPLGWDQLDSLSAQGVRHVFLTHAAGLSATGDAALDAALPLPERYRIPKATVRAIEQTKGRGGRVIAVGTTVVRALEAAALDGFREERGTARIRLSRGFRRQVVDAIITGMHSPGESHFELLGAFAKPQTLAAAHAHAAAEGYLAHELGDLMLLLPGGRKAHV